MQALADPILHLSALLPFCSPVLSFSLKRRCLHGSNVVERVFAVKGRRKAAGGVLLVNQLLGTSWQTPRKETKGHCDKINQ